MMPAMQCDSGCGHCCGLAPATEAEFQKVKRYVTAKGIVPVDQGVKCPFYQNGTCAVYEVRPFACQLFGHSARMPCSRGYNVNIDPVVAKRLVQLNGQPVRLLHELLPNLDIEKLKRAIDAARDATSVAAP